MSDKPFKHYDLHAIYCAAAWKRFEFVMEIRSYTDEEGISTEAYDLITEPHLQNADGTMAWCWGDAPDAGWGDATFADEADMQEWMDRYAHGLAGATIDREPPDEQPGAVLAEFYHVDTANHLYVRFAFLMPAA